MLRGPPLSSNVRILAKCSNSPHCTCVGTQEAHQAQYMNILSLDELGSGLQFTLTCSLLVSASKAGYTLIDDKSKKWKQITPPMPNCVDGGISHLLVSPAAFQNI